MFLWNLICGSKQTSIKTSKVVVKKILFIGGRNHYLMTTKYTVAGREENKSNLYQKLRELNGGEAEKSLVDIIIKYKHDMEHPRTMLADDEFDMCERGCPLCIDCNYFYEWEDGELCEGCEDFYCHECWKCHGTNRALFICDYCSEM